MRLSLFLLGNLQNKMIATTICFTHVWSSHLRFIIDLLLMLKSMYVLPLQERAQSASFQLIWTNMISA